MLVSPISPHRTTRSPPFCHTVLPAISEPRQGRRTRTASTKSSSRATSPSTPRNQFVTPEEFGVAPRRTLSFVSDTSSTSSSSSSSRRSSRPTPRGVSYKDLVQTRPTPKLRIYEADNEPHTSFLYSFPQPSPTPKRRSSSPKPRKKKVFVNDTILRMKKGRLFPPDATELAEANRSITRRRICRADRLLFDELIAKPSDPTPRPSPVPTPPTATSASTLCSAAPSRTNSDFSDAGSISTAATSLSSSAPTRTMSNLSLLWLKSGDVKLTTPPKAMQLGSRERPPPCTRVAVDLDDSPLGTVRVPEVHVESCPSPVEQIQQKPQSTNFVLSLWGGACALADAYARATTLTVSVYAPTPEVIHNTIPRGRVVAPLDPAQHGYRARTTDVRQFLEPPPEISFYHVAELDPLDESEFFDEESSACARDCTCRACPAPPRLRPIANPITLRVRALTNSLRSRSKSRVRFLYPGVLGAGNECVLSWARTSISGGSPLVKEVDTG